MQLNFRQASGATGGGDQTCSRLACSEAAMAAAGAAPACACSLKPAASVTSTCPQQAHV